MNTDPTQALNKAVQQFGDETLAEMRGKISSLNIRGKQHLLKLLKSDKAKAKMQERIASEGITSKLLKKKIYYRYGEATGIGFKMPKQAIYVVKGVGKGHPISNPRTAKDFVNDPINKRLEKLADQVVEIYGDKVEINAFKANIK